MPLNKQVVRGEALLASQAVDFSVVWQIVSAHVPCEGQQFLGVWQIDSAHVPSTGGSARSRLWRAYQDSEEEGKGEAVRAHSCISIVGPKKQRDEDHHIETCQRSDALWGPAHMHIRTHLVMTSFCQPTLPCVKNFGLERAVQKGS